MAKKKTVRRKAAPGKGTSDVKVKLSTRDKRTLGQLTELADGVVSAADRRRDPYVDVPTRSLSNVRYNRTKKIIEMGKNTNRRQLFNLSQAKSFMQTMLVASGATQLIEQGKTTSIRGLFYLLKHTIEGTKEETFAEQSECDPVIEDVEVLLNSLREELHLYAQKRGDMVGNLVLVDSGDEIDCSRMGSGGYGIPSIVEPEVIQFNRCDAKFVLHVEKDTVWQRFNEFCLLDNDPWGYYIYSVIKQGSINLAFESRRMAVPGARFLGLRSVDFERCKLSDSVKIDLNDTDRKRAKQIASYPWFAHKKPWQKEIKRLLQNGFKLEVEALISRDISYVTEEYTPSRLKNRDWLD